MFRNPFGSLAQAPFRPAKLLRHDAQHFVNNNNSNKLTIFDSTRFGPSSLHQRDSRSALFEGYTGDNSRRPVSASPSRGYGYGGYPGAASPAGSGHLGVDNNGFRPATPNRRGQYSDAVLNELESQNDAQVEGILGKVKVLKSVCFRPALLEIGTAMQYRGE